MNGYIINFAGHGAFDPDGKVKREMTPEQIKAHNQELAQEEINSMKASGFAVLYEYGDLVGTWDKSFTFKVSYKRSSFHNMAGKDGRTDYWFTGPDGANWHGVNIGDNQIVRCRRVKS